MKNIKNKVLDEYKKGNIVVLTHDGLACFNLKKFIEQPSEGILYDLNRDFATILTFIDDPKWINDYASSVVIMELKNKINELLEIKNK